VAIKLFTRVLVKLFGDIEKFHRADAFDQVELVGVLLVDVVGFGCVNHFVLPLPHGSLTCRTFFLLALLLLLG